MLGGQARRLAAVVAVVALGACGRTTEPAAVAPAPAIEALAGSVVDGLQRNGMPIGFVLRYTVATDPEHLLGRPGGYVSKADFSDTRIVRSTGTPRREDASGSVEVFATEAEAQARYAFFQAFIQYNALLKERVILERAVVLRLTEKLSADQVAAYHAALRMVLGLPSG